MASTTGRNKGSRPAPGRAVESTRKHPVYGTTRTTRKADTSKPDGPTGRNKGSRPAPGREVESTRKHPVYGTTSKTRAADTSKPDGPTGRNKSKSSPPKPTSSKSSKPASSKPASDKPVKTVKTKGGDYPVYKKSSDKAKSFRQAFAEARKAGKKTFTWDGRKYSTKVK